MPTLKSSFLQAQALDFQYPDQILFCDFTARFPAGITLIRGADGRGKSTLLRLLSGSLAAKSGQLHINGVDWQSQRESYMAKVFWIDPRTDAHDELTALEFFQLQRSSYPHLNDDLLTTISHGLGLQAHLHKQLFMLSTGSKRKVFMAAALASGAVVTLLDQPFAALDQVSIGFMLTWLTDTHNVSNRVWVIADHVVPDGLPLAHLIDLGD